MNLNLWLYFRLIKVCAADVKRKGSSYLNHIKRLLFSKVFKLCCNLIVLRVCFLIVMFLLSDFVWGCCSYVIAMLIHGRIEEARY